MKKILMIVFCATALYAQDFEPADYFPFHVGDVWEYQRNTDSGYERWDMVRDSAAAEGHYLYIKGHAYAPSGKSPIYLVDTNMYVTEDPFSPLAWLRYRSYKLDADSGDTWLTWVSDDSLEQGRALVSDAYDSYVLGRSSRVMVIDYYEQRYGDSLWQDGMLYSHTDHLAAGFGFIFRYRDGAEWPDYSISGAKIDNVTSGTLVSVEESDETLPLAFALKPNYPNPFNPVTTIAFSLDKKEHIELGVYDMRGRRVALLALGEYAPGSYSYRFDAGYLASGKYIYYLKTRERTLTGRMTLLK